MSTIGYVNISMETFGGVLSLVFIICLCITGSQRQRLERLYIRLLICNTVLLFCDAAAWLFKGRLDPFSSAMVHISNFLVFSLGYLMLVLFTHYLTGFLSAKDSRVTKIPLYLMRGLMLLAVCLVIVSQFNNMYYLIDEHNVYQRQSWFWLSQAFGIAGMLLNSFFLLRYRKLLRRKELWAFAAYICLPVTAMLFQILFYGVAVLYLATTVCLLCIYISIQLAVSQEAAQKELELEGARTAIMLSQIQPHFLYNSLTGMKELCDTGDQKATSKALEHFAYYLRGNMNSLSDKGLIPFSQEVSHVRDYLYLEQMRFEEKLHIVWELNATDFLLPSLTLQPIAENAVRHGITEKKGGGTLTIRSEETGKTITITVKDDGAGFDMQEKKDDGRTHIGISNVKKRLAAQCGGSLYIESECGTGTIVKIILPKTEVIEHEDFSG